MGVVKGERKGRIERQNETERERGRTRQKENENEGCPRLVILDCNFSLRRA